MTTEERFILIYILGWLATSLISSVRAVRKKQGSNHTELDVLGYMFNWWMILPIFLIRWTKYKMRGEDI